MSLKHKTKVYLSLNHNLLCHVKERAVSLGINRAKYITDILQSDYEKCIKEKEKDK